MKFLSLYRYFPCAFVTVLPGQFPVCWLSPVQAVKHCALADVGIAGQRDNSVVFRFFFNLQAAVDSIRLLLSILKSVPFIILLNYRLRDD